MTTFSSVFSTVPMSSFVILLRSSALQVDFSWSCHGDVSLVLLSLEDEGGHSGDVEDWRTEESDTPSSSRARAITGRSSFPHQSRVTFKLISRPEKIDFP